MISLLAHKCQGISIFSVLKGMENLPHFVIDIFLNTENLHLECSCEKEAEECFQNSLAVTERVKTLMPQFHTRAMHKAMFEQFGRVSPGVKPAVL